MSANILTSKYMAAKQAMIDAYRGLHKAPAYTTWNEVQALQEQMQSAAVELAEYMTSIKDGSWRESITGSPEPEAAPIQWTEVSEVEHDQFYSKTSDSYRSMWRMKTNDGRKVNLFDHSDPLRDQSPLLKESGYEVVFRAMDIKQIDIWETSPIHVNLVADGSFWKVIKIKPCAEGASPDLIDSDLGEFFPNEPRKHHQMFYPQGSIDLKDQLWDMNRAAGLYDDVLGPVKRDDPDGN